MNLDPIVQIIFQVLITLTPHIVSGFGQEIGSGLAKAPIKVFQSLRERNKKKSEVQSILLYLLKSPNDLQAQEVFRRKLVMVLEQDSSLVFLRQLQHLISIHKPSLTKELSPFIEILQPAIYFELRQKSPRPKRLLQNVVDGLGRKLEFAGIFDSKDEYKTGWELNHDVGGFRNVDEYRRRVPLTKLANAFYERHDEMYLARIASYGRLGDRGATLGGKVKLIRREPKTLLEKILPSRRYMYSFRIEYKGYDIFRESDYHIYFAKESKKVYSRYIRENETTNHLLTADNIEKFIVSIVTDFNELIRPLTEVSEFLKKSANKN